MTDLAAFKSFAKECATKRKAGVGVRPAFADFALERTRNESSTLVLRDCRVDRAEIASRFWWMCWEDVEFDRVDFSHTGGVAHWTNCSFRRCRLRSLMASVSAAYCEFGGCDFRSAVLDAPFFLGCTFRSLSLTGLVLKRAILIDCHFEDVDLGDSKWYETRRFEVSGSWVGERRELLLPSPPQAPP